MGPGKWHDPQNLLDRFRDVPEAPNSPAGATGRLAEAGGAREIAA
jgi:hypothetical protein